MSIQVEILERIGDIPRSDWAAVVNSANASVFYDYDFLSSYEQGPLEPQLAQRYLLARDSADCRPCAILPVYLYEPVDTYGDLAEELPHEAARCRGLLTHVWHCYESQLPARRQSIEITAGICSSMRNLARDQGAGWYGFINVSDVALRVQLLSVGFQSFQMPERYVMNLENLPTFASYVGQLNRSRRREILRQRRWAEDAAATIQINVPPFVGIDEVVELIRSTAARHQFEAYYPMSQLTGFLQAKGPLTRLITVHHHSVLVGAIVGFLERNRIHAWAGGARYDLTRFSPWAVALLRCIELGIDTGCQLFEAGRSNGTVKQRYGLHPVPLFALLASV